jgi:hypothetical protein
VSRGTYKSAAQVPRKCFADVLGWRSNGNGATVCRELARDGTFSQKNIINNFIIFKRGYTRCCELRVNCFRISVKRGVWRKIDRPFKAIVEFQSIY